MSSHSLRWRIPVVALVVAACLLFVYPPFDPDGSGPREGKLKLGLDLRGGMHLVLRVKTETLPVAERKTAAERAVGVIRNRIDQFGVSEPVIQQQGEDRLMIQLPGVSDRERALALIGKTAHLEFRMVTEGGETAGGVKFAQSEGGDIWLEPTAPVEGKMLKDARQDLSHDFMEPTVLIQFNSEGAKKFGEVTTRGVGRRMAIVLDDVVLSAPVIREPILNGDAVISGSFTLDTARDLAIALKAGALPAPIEIQEERTVGPSLGKDSIDQGMRAMYWAAMFVVLFMAVYYMLGGMIANSALLINILIIGGLLAYFKGTLTLPGIAGIILTIGMAVDANVLIMERIREELALGKSVTGAVSAGYKKAFWAIFDSNVTTLLTAFILFYVGTGPIRGFATTMIIGIIGSFFSALFVTRVIFDIVVPAMKLKTLHMMHLLPAKMSIPFLRAGRILAVISMLIVIIGIFSISTRGMQQLGVDFSGGSLQEFRFEKPIDADALRSALKSVDLQSATIQKVGDTQRDFILRTPADTENLVLKGLGAAITDNKFERVRLETVGPIVGQELKEKAFLAIILSLIGILIYVAARFELSYSTGAIVALFHDAIISLAFVVWTGREISISVLAAVLTIVGFSVNDTIVIFDRVRENNRRGLKLSLKELINLSINETLSRTILTSFTVFIVVGALYWFGGPVINDFAFTMLVGVVVGTYSTIYVACPLVAYWPWKKHIKR
jgi:SecD/SecF fusion protein